MTKLNIKINNSHITENYLDDELKGDFKPYLLDGFFRFGTKKAAIGYALTMQCYDFSVNYSWNMFFHSCIK